MQHTWLTSTTLNMLAQRRSSIHSVIVLPLVRHQHS
jgi:hypothetical protein